MVCLRLLLLAFALLFATSTAQQRQSNISIGSSLTPHDEKSSWLSNSGLYAFGFYKQGDGFSVGIFMAGIPQKTVVWTANRDSPPVAANAILRFTSEGRFVLQPSAGEEQNIGDDVLPASSASMLDSGNLVLYGSDGSIIWESFQNPTDTLLPTQRLLAGYELVSSASESDHSSGRFRLKMQHDGNMVQYPVRTADNGSNAYYSSETYWGGNNVSLVFDSNIRLYMMNSTGVNIRNLTDRDYPTKDRIHLMRIDVDGIFSLYSYPLSNDSDWSIIWSSSNDKCDPKGLCGFNGFCVNNDEEADCRCLPGFDFVKKGNWGSGCERNFAADSCENKNKSLAYAVVELSSTLWQDNAYAVVQVQEIEGCRQACSDDCNCEAAFYKDRECRKQRLPLQYGRRVLNDQNVALIKVYNSTPPVEKIVPNGSGEKIRKDILIVSIVLVSFGCIMIVSSIFVLWRGKFYAYKKINQSYEEAELIGGGVGLRSFTYEELEKMTDGFKEKIGKGSFGTVYKGTILNSQKEVAVKKLEKLSKEGESEFQSEMKAIGRTHHKNLVRLLGYCYEGPNRLLVYEYMSNGSLADMLFNPENKPCWEERLGITCGIASGILYLHEECATQIIHCDIKPENILIDEHGRAKISDFGLAKRLKPDQTKTYTRIRGTRGYVAPEWHRKQPITAKADVYSFGIVMLEIICCRKNLSWDLPEEEAVLEEWVYDCFERGELIKLVGSEEIDKRQLERLVKVALWCIQDEPSMRPAIKKVLLMLEGTVEIPVPPNPEFFSAQVTS